MLQVSQATVWINPGIAAVSVGDGVAQHRAINDGGVKAGRSGAYSCALASAAAKTSDNQEKNQKYFEVEFGHDCLLNSNKLHFSQKRLNRVYMIVPFFDIF